MGLLFHLLGILFCHKMHNKKLQMYFKFESHLRDDINAAAQILQAQAGHVNSVNEHCPADAL